MLGQSLAPELAADDSPNHPELTSDTQAKSLLGKVVCASFDQKIERTTAEMDQLSPLNLAIVNVVYDSEVPLSSGKVYEALSRSGTTPANYHGHDINGAMVRFGLEHLQSESVGLVKEIEPGSGIYAHPDYDYAEYLALFNSEP